MAIDFEKIASAAIILVFLIGIAFFRSPRTARFGNWLNILGYIGAVVLVAIIYPVLNPTLALLAILIGGTAGSLISTRVDMRGVPQMIAFQHGCGGVAAFLIAFSEFIKAGESLDTLARSAAILGIIVGAATFSSSLAAAGKLAGKFKPQPVNFPAHSRIIQGLMAAIVMLGVVTVLQGGLPAATGTAVVIIFLSILLGITFTIRIGGADMPVVISFLNAMAGFAAAFCGIVINNYLLIGCGAVVGASGSLLTLTMCKAMNRSFFSILAGHKPRMAATGNATVRIDAGTVQAKTKTVSLDDILPIVKNAKKVIIVPGYGMALAQAQSSVKALEEWLEKNGANVRYAIHPVAGRMPGHMNVLLAEAGVDYDKLIEMQDINGDFKDTDLAIIIGACDVINPSAIYKEGTPISGMPILNAQQARAVIVFNFDNKPGFSGVENPLYQMDTSYCLWGDAKDNIDSLNSRLSGK